MKEKYYLTERYEKAIIYAIKLHADQKRKSTQIPYVTHLLSVSALVLEDGGDEDQAIAALLHDAAEDQGGYQRLEEINRMFGDRVAAIVDGCTDTYSNPKPPWRERKENYLAHLKEVDEDILRVSLADKLHNARSIVRDLQVFGETTWEKFNGGREGTIWYYRELDRIFKDSGYRSILVDEFSDLVSEIQLYA